MTVFAMIAVLATTGVALIAFVLMGLTVALNATETAADQAALAGAGRAIAGQSHACDIAERVARAHGAALTSCEVDQSHVWVKVERPITPALTPLLNRLGVGAMGLVALSHAEQPFMPI